MSPEKKIKKSKIKKKSHNQVIGYKAFMLMCPHYINPSPAEPRYTLPLQTVDPDQLASEESESVCHSVCEFIATIWIK